MAKMKTIRCAIPARKVPGAVTKARGGWQFHQFRLTKSITGKQLSALVTRPVGPKGIDTLCVVRGLGPVRGMTIDESRRYQKGDFFDLWTVKTKRRAPAAKKRSRR